MAPGWFLQLQVDFSWCQVVFQVFYGSRSGFHDSKWIFIDQGWFKSELSTAGAK